eukprot:s3927_g2.t1
MEENVGEFRCFVVSSNFPSPTSWPCQILASKPAVRSDMHVIGSLAGFWVRRTLNTSSEVQAQLTAFRSKAQSPPVSPGSAPNPFTMPRADSAGCSQSQDGVLSRNSSLSADEAMQGLPRLPAP